MSRDAPVGSTAAIRECVARCSLALTAGGDTLSFVAFVAARTVSAFEWLTALQDTGRRMFR